MTRYPLAIIVAIVAILVLTASVSMRPQRRVRFIPKPDMGELRCQFLSRMAETHFAAGILISKRSADCAEFSVESDLVRQEEFRRHFLDDFNASFRILKFRQVEFKAGAPDYYYLREVVGQ